MEATLVFIHGLESTSQGTKGQYFQHNFPEMIIEDYTGDFAQRMKKLASVLAGKNNLVLVGSSYGGLMAAQFAIQNHGYEPHSKLRDIIPSATRDCSTYQFLSAAQPELEFHNESRVKKLILLAPALNLPEFRPSEHESLNLPVIIYHGINDNIVDPYLVKSIAGKVFSQLEHHLVDDDHSLHNIFPTIDWNNLLQSPQVR